MSDTHNNISLRALQVFEASVRCGSFTLAGDDLGITQSGVSRQVSDLEATLGVTLFVRRGTRLQVTPAGQRLAEKLAEAFGQIWTSVNEAKRSEHVVTLSMLPSVATHWFAPRLGRFLSENPEVDLRITASRHLVDFEAEGIDAAIRYSPSKPKNLNACFLSSETVRPVCTPEYALRKQIKRPDDLRTATLLHGDIPEDWDAWFLTAGCAFDPNPGPKLGDDAAILHAVLNHQGVALGRSRLVADSLAEGKLIQPFDIALDASHAYWFVWPERGAPSKAFQRVSSWLETEFRDQTDPQAG